MGEAIERLVALSGGPLFGGKQAKPFGSKGAAKPAAADDASGSDGDDATESGAEKSAEAKAKGMSTQELMKMIMSGEDKKAGGVYSAELRSRRKAKSGDGDGSDKENAADTKTDKPNPFAKN